MSCARNAPATGAVGGVVSPSLHQGYVGAVRTEGPMLIVNPRSDDVFVARAQSLAGSAETPNALEAQLREEYPDVRVHERGLHGEVVTWYVYREGRWIPGGS